MLGGIAGGLSNKLGLDVTVVRIGLVLFALATSGFGVTVYVLAWLVVPQRDEPSSILRRAMGDMRGIALAVALIPVLAVALLVGSALHAGWLGSLAWSMFMSAAGLVLIFRNAGDDEREMMRKASQPLSRLSAGSSKRSWVSFVERIALGLVLMVCGVAGLTLGHGHTIFRPFAGSVLVIAGFVVIFGPWWLSLARELVAERQARARAEARADLAARLHDSVLQTLALIQRRADEPQQVVRLARAQERELRAWLFEDRPPGGSHEDHTFSEGIARIQREVEESHGVPIEAVVVGDCPLDHEGLRALLAAGREATVNAAKWSKAPVISLFAEVDGDSVSLYVRDRGVGFDPATIAADRRGVSESIHGRMARHGGSAQIKSAPGEGTEVALRVERGAGDRPAEVAGRRASRQR